MIIMSDLPLSTESMPETPDAVENAPTSPTTEVPTGPGASFTFIYYFSTAAFITALFTVKLFGVGLTTGLPGQFALIGGAVGGTLGVLFNRSRTLEVPFQSAKKFRQQLNNVLTDMGYAMQARDGQTLRYQKPNAARFFAGDIFVYEREKSVIIVSRASNIRTLTRRLLPE